MRKCVKGERFCQRKYTILSVPCEGYSRNESCTLHLISTFYYCNVEFDIIVRDHFLILTLSLLYDAKYFELHMGLCLK